MAAKSAALACAPAVLASTERRTPPQRSGSHEASRPTLFKSDGEGEPPVGEVARERVEDAERPTVGKNAARAVTTAARDCRYWASACATFWLETSTCRSSSLSSAMP